MHVRGLPPGTQTDRCIGFTSQDSGRALTGPPRFPPAATKPQRLVASFRQSSQAAVLASNMSPPPRVPSSRRGLLYCTSDEACSWHFTLVLHCELERAL